MSYAELKREWRLKKKGEWERERERERERGGGGGGGGAQWNKMRIEECTDRESERIHRGKKNKQTSL